VPRVRALQVAGEPGHDRKPLMPPHNTAARRLCGELERQRGSDQRRVALLEERGELGQHPAVHLELEPEPATQLEIVAHRVIEPGHDSDPGHGSASWERARRSTLA